MKLSQNKNIAIVIPGGIGTGNDNIGVPVLEQLVRRLSGGYAITVFSLFKVNDDFQAEGFELVSIPSKNIFLKSFQFLIAFREHHHKKKFVLVHGFWASLPGFLAVAAAKLFHSKSVISVLGGDATSLPEINYGALRRWLPKKIILWSLRQADEVIVLTNFLKQNLKQHGLRREMKIIPWGIDTRLFFYREKQQSSVIQFLHIANLSAVKNQDTLLKAFSLIQKQKPSHLTIIGEGSMEGTVKRLVTELNLEDSVTILKPVPYPAIAEHYHRSDVLLHTSLSEGQSEVVTEAMSCGVLVCGTSVGLLYDLPECCVSVPVRQHKQLATSVLGILNDPQEIQRLKERARDWTHHHSLEWTNKKIEEIYERILKPD